jgi:hypothetical protein
MLYQKVLPMSDEFEKYRAQPLDEFEQYRAKKIPEKKGAKEKIAQNITKELSAEEKAAQLKQRSPMLYSLAEKLQGSPLIEKAGKIAGQFNRGVEEQTALPSLAKGFLGTGIEMGRGLANLIPGVNIPEPHYSEHFVHPLAKEGFETIGSLGMGLPAYRGYQGAKAGIEALKHANKLPSLVKNMLAGGIVGSAISPEHRGLGGILGASAETLPFIGRGIKQVAKNYNVGAREKDYFKAMMEHELQKAEEERLRATAKHEFGNTNPESLMLSAADKQAQLEEAQAFEKNHLANQKMLPGEQHPAEIEHAIEQNENNLRHQLGEGNTNIQDLSNHIVEAIEGVPTTRPHPKTGLPQEIREGGLRKEIGAKYDKLENGLPPVEIPGDVNLKAVEKDMQQYEHLPPDIKEQFREAFEQFHSAKGKKTIDGRKFFRMYRSMRRLEGEERSKAFGLNPEAHDQWLARADKTKKTYEDMEKIIDQHFPKDTIKRLHEINHEYANQVAPLHENSMYQQMKEHGRYNGSVIDYLSGTTKGNTILRKMIMADPKLSRLALGHSFAENPNKLLKPNVLLNEYLAQHPEIANLVGSQKANQQKLTTATKNAELYKNTKMIPELTTDVKRQRQIAKQLENEAEASGASKNQADKMKHEYMKAERKRKTLINRLITGGLITGSVGYAGSKIRE